MQIRDGRLHTEAFRLSSEFTNRYGDKLWENLQALEPDLPGISTLKPDLYLARTGLRDWTLPDTVGRMVLPLVERNTPESRSEALRIVRALRKLIEQAPMTENEVRRLIRISGGIFIGTDELVKQGKLGRHDVVPNIPQEFANRSFLKAKHPLRDGSIAKNILLGFEPRTRQWHAINRDQGGCSDMVPRSLGLSSERQDALLFRNGVPICIEGVELVPPPDSFAISEIINSAYYAHLLAGKPEKSAPFYGTHVRTGSGWRYNRIVLQFTYYEGQGGMSPFDCYSSETAYQYIGSIACWLKKKA